MQHRGRLGLEWGRVAPLRAMLDTQRQKPCDHSIRSFWQRSDYTDCERPQPKDQSTGAAAASSFLTVHRVHSECVGYETAADHTCRCRRRCHRQKATNNCRAARRRPPQHLIQLGAQTPRQPRRRRRFCATTIAATGGDLHLQAHPAPATDGPGASVGHQNANCRGIAKIVWSACSMLTIRAHAPRPHGARRTHALAHSIHFVF